jgi:hypothetical protein
MKGKTTHELRLMRERFDLNTTGLLALALTVMILGGGVIVALLTIVRY